MKIYLASRYHRRPEMVKYVYKLTELGHETVSRWVWGDHDAAICSPRRAAEEDMEDLMLADCLILFAEESRCGSHGGRHVEFGMALARGIRTIVVGPRENVFMHLGAEDLEHYDTVEELFEVLREERFLSQGAMAYNGAAIDECEATPDEAGGTKDDFGKLPYHLISTHALRELAEVLAFGAKKYGARNWEQGMDYSRLYGAALRHMQAWWSGEDLDGGEGGTGRTHLAGALFSIHCLTHLVAEGVGPEFDDRPDQMFTVNADKLAMEVPIEWPGYGRSTPPLPPLPEEEIVRLKKSWETQQTARFGEPIPDITPTYDWVTTWTGDNGEGYKQRLQTFKEVDKIGDEGVDESTKM